jgi:hypothetical protein
MLSAQFGRIRSAMAPDPVSMIHKHIYESVPALPPSLGRIQGLVDCLPANKPEDRYSNARDILAAIRSALSTQPAANDKRQAILI